MICGHYEGIDERLVDLYGAEEVSLGDFVLTGGEIPALAFIDATVRLLAGAINAESLTSESFTRRPPRRAGLYAACKFSRASPSRTSCSPATMPESRPGDANSRASARSRAAATSSTTAVPARRASLPATADAER